MKTWCLKNNLTGNIFKVFLTKEGLNEYLERNSDIEECIDCIECADAPSITLE
jgi:polyferredoxin